MLELDIDFIFSHRMMSRQPHVAPTRRYQRWGGATVQQRRHLRASCMPRIIFKVLVSLRFDHSLDHAPLFAFRVCGYARGVVWFTDSPLTQVTESGEGL